MRRHLTFECAGESLVGTLDDAGSVAGLLLVSGGNETRAGAFSGQAHLAARIAAAGHPVFRYDRRGIGDSTGLNEGYRSSAPDICAAIAAFRAHRPGLARIVAFGNCDAASALMLNGGAGCHALVLANPWTFEDDNAPPPPQAIRARYREKLRNPREVLRLLSGGVSLGKLAGGIAGALRPAAPPTSLARQMRAGVTGFPGSVRYLVAGNDRTGRAFSAALPDLLAETCVDAGHAFGEPHAHEWLCEQLLAALGEQARQFDMS